MCVKGPVTLLKDASVRHWQQKHAFKLKQSTIGSKSSNHGNCFQLVRRTFVYSKDIECIGIGRRTMVAYVSVKVRSCSVVLAISDSAVGVF